MIIIITWAVGLVCGMYLVTQISKSFTSERSNEKLINNINKLKKNGITKREGKGKP